MILEFSSIHDNGIKVDFSKVKAIKQCHMNNGLCFCDFMSEREAIPFINGSIDDLVKAIYNEGFKKGKSESKTSDEDEHELKGYIKTKYGTYIKASSIVGFSHNGNYLHAWCEGDDDTIYVFDMSLEDFINMLTKALEETNKGSD